MSRLRELRLHGFKTFADPTRFVFDPGVNAIIGPNGSGKSNMADAVRWVLGEQSNRSLRTRRADDVIFAGSEHRKPQGMAEAVLTLDNEDGWLPIEFAEVSIGRRAYRSGESEYLINGARARLRDVVELLGEGRLGANELVVVGQGTVDAALSLRPEERRQLFEEAAGVKNLQVRKNEALARLSRATDNLVRVRDLMSELKPQVRRLALQAEHQQEHDQLGRRALALVTETHRRREAGERAALGEARRRAAAAEAELESHRAQQEAGRRALTDAEERYWQADTAARGAADLRESTRETLIRAESRLDGLEGRVRDLERAVAQATEELRQAEDTTAVPVAATDLERVFNAAAEAEATWRAAGDALREADAASLAAEEELAVARRLEADRVAQGAQAGELRAAAEARIGHIDPELVAARGELSALMAAMTNLGAAAESAAAAASAARADHDAARQRLAEAQPRADDARRRSAELAERVGAMRGELEALHERAEGGGRLGSMLTAAGWGPLLDGLDAPEETWPAIEAVVGGELEQALMWQDGEIVARLAQARGAARLLTIGEPAIEPAQRAGGLAAVGASQTLAEWLDAERAPELFWRVAIAPDIDTLLNGWRSLPIGWLAVTPAGDLADSRGLVAVRGRAEPPAVGAARRHARRRELAEALERLEAEQSTTTTLAAQGHAAVSESMRELDAARARLADAEREETLRQGAVDDQAARIERTTARIADLESALAEAGAQRDRVDPPVADPSLPSVSLATLERDAEHARAARQHAAEQRDAARTVWLAARSAADDADRQAAGSRQRRSLAEARRTQLRAELPAQRATLMQLVAERDAHRATVAEARLADEEAAKKRDAADSERVRLRSELRALEQGGGATATRLVALETAAQAAAIEVSRREDGLAAVERERELALDSLPEMVEAPAATAAGEAISFDEVDDASLEAELRRVRRTLSQIGSVNPFAVEEHREVAARLAELTAQDTDLTNATTSTEELIARLDAEITEQFHAAFTAIGERFDEFCRLLFAGGSASLQLGSEEDGDAPGGIEIVVRPPGKRLQRLAMLSGGERALTGVALLFAMLSVNPVPFCILDEVDAALDEANIGRFADALRKLAEKTDFVVITHNRATIEVADTIYGVTMTDAAVSRVVSLRLADLPAGAKAEVPAR